MTKKYFLSLLLVLSLAVLGCVKKKEEAKLLESDLAPIETQVVEPTQPITITPTQETTFTVAPVLSEEEQKLVHNKQTQEALKASGYYQGEIDGKIGPVTRKAIREFQTAKGLTVDGKVGPKTWAELEKVLASQTTVSSFSPTN